MGNAWTSRDKGREKEREEGGRERDLAFIDSFSR